VTRLRVALLVLAAAGASAPPAAAQVHDARLQGHWKMSGRVTRADGVRGEHAGQRVTRAWDFTSTCASGPCTRVTLRRERSAHRVDVLTLRRTSAGVLEGSGQFFVPLRCSGRTYPQGGIAYFTVHLKIGKAAVVQGKRFGTRISATYVNSRRVNRTPCPGSLGRDAGTYSGRLSSPVPAPPVADFGSSVDPVSGTATFSDASSSPSGAKVVGWQWDFGDPGSGASNTSTDPNPSHQYASGGTYDVRLTVTDSNGLTATVTHQVSVTPHAAARRSSPPPRPEPPPARQPSAVRSSLHRSADRGSARRTG
jgi:hypothetical protein